MMMMMMMMLCRFAERVLNSPQTRCQSQSNRWVLRCQVNGRGQSMAVRREAGRLLQMCGPATAKLLIPSVVVVLGTIGWKDESTTDNVEVTGVGEKKRLTGAVNSLIIQLHGVYFPQRCRDSDGIITLEFITEMPVTAAAAAVLPSSYPVSYTHLRPTRPY